MLRNPSNRLGAESGRRRQYVPVNHEALQIFATAHPSSRWTETLNTERFHKRDPTKQLGVRSSNLSEIVCTCNLQLGCRMKCLKNDVGTLGIGMDPSYACANPLQRYLAAGRTDHRITGLLQPAYRYCDRLGHDQVHDVSRRELIQVASEPQGQPTSTRLVTGCTACRSVPSKCPTCKANRAR